MDSFAKTRRRILGRALAFCLCGVFCSIALTRAAAGAESASEYQVKAVFLLNFTRFVQWPPEAFATPNEPFVIGILGNDPFGPRLDEVIRNERIGEHPLVVHRFRTPEELGDCQMLFIALSDGPTIARVIAGLHHRSVLTVSEADAAAEHGAMIQLATESGHIRLRINVDAAHTAGLVISSKLLHLAEIVGTRPGD
ncbi:MAG TPA: YfiR family protein [Steroidobacteraceae bacterium]|jgi:hypothetical protein|nr:YfiR family protein [Steroidobacteraceae bacterium]